MKQYRYKVIYGDGGPHREECGNNKSVLIRYANESRIRATVIDAQNGDILHENAAQRRINNSLTKLHQITSRLKSGVPVEKVIDLPY